MTSNSHSLLQQGRQLHQLGQLSQALACFREALALDTSNLDAANACATVLLEQGRGKEAFQLLNFRREALLQDADFACNWAIVCEEVKQTSLAIEGYESALKLQPMHVRALNNSALLAARAQRWKVAIARLEAAHAQVPNDAAMGCNLCDALLTAHEDVRALAVIENLLELEDGEPATPLLIRRAALLAFNQQWERACQA